MTLSHLTLSDSERSKLRSLIFRSISHKGEELGHMLLLNINRKSYMGSPSVWLNFILGTLKGQCQGHSDCEGAELGHMLLLNTNRKSYMGSPIVPSHLTLSDIER